MSSRSPRRRGLYIVAPHVFNDVYGPEERADIERLVTITAPPQSILSIRENPAPLADAEVLFGSWGFPRLDAEFLAAAPRLEAVFYAAGSVRNLVTPEFWERGITLTSAAAANAAPVAEYVLSQIFFCLKHGWQSVLKIRQTGVFSRSTAVPGAYRSTVGLVSLGLIGRLVCERLRPFDLKIIACDPFVTAEEGARLGVEMTSLEDVFRRSDLVSLHTPWLPETTGLITGALVDSMKPGATLMNSSRGAIIDEPAMIEVLQRRPDLFALLDVSWPEPPVPGSPLYSLPNIVLTPHIAGSMGPECRRMARSMIDELRLFLEGSPLRWAVTREKSLLLA